MNIVTMNTRTFISGIKYSLLLRSLASVILGILILGCPSISLFDQQAYIRTTDLKVESLALMDKATDDYSMHANEVYQLTINIEKAYEYEKGRPHNEISTQMWEILKSPDRNLLGGFMKRWSNEQKLGRGFIDASKKQAAQGFDLIAGLESAKIKPEEANSLFKNLVP